MCRLSALKIFVTIYENSDLGMKNKSRKGCKLCLIIQMFDIQERKTGNALNKKVLRNCILHYYYHFLRRNPKIIITIEWVFILNIFILENKIKIQ